MQLPPAMNVPVLLPQGFIPSVGRSVYFLAWSVLDRAKRFFLSSLVRLGQPGYL